MACEDCKQSIYNTQDSSIATPLCQGDCPQEVDCNGEVTYTDCVASTVALSCINKSVGATQTAINQAFDTALCNIGGGCNTWTELTKGNLGLASGWSWAGSGFEKPAISDVKGCIVRLAGTVVKSIGTAPLYGQITVGILPVGKRPVNYRRYPVVITTNGAYPFQSTMLTIAPTGEMTFLNIYPLTSVTNFTLSFDGITIETNTII